MHAGASRAFHHQSIAQWTARGAITRPIHHGLLLILVILLLTSREARYANGPPVDPMEQFTQQECSDAEQDDRGDRFPDHSIHELVDLRIRHAKNESNFAA